MLDLYNSDTIINFHRSVLHKTIDQTVFDQFLNHSFDELFMSKLVYALNPSDFAMVSLCELLAPYFLNKYKESDIPYLADNFNYIVGALNDNIVAMFNSRDYIRADVDQNHDRHKCRLLLNAYDVSNVNDIFICSPWDLKYVYSEKPTQKDIISLVDYMLDVFSFIISDMVSGDYLIYDVSNLCSHTSPYGSNMYFFNVLTSVTYAYGNYSDYYHKVLLNVISLFKSSDVAAKPIDVVSLLERAGLSKDYAANGSNVHNSMNITYNDVFDSFNL